jgi:hypothetical protein
MFTIDTADAAGTLVGSPIELGCSAYKWRKARGLLTISDHIRVYRAIRAPRGNYAVPMPDDLIAGWQR